MCGPPLSSFVTALYADMEENMNFPVALLVAGLVLLLIGLLGRIRIKEFEAGTDSKPIRATIALFGVGLLAGALLA